MGLSLKTMRRFYDICVQDKQKNDTDTFREILQYIHEYSMTSVLAVVWCVTPQVSTVPVLCTQQLTSVYGSINSNSGMQVRTDASLRTQAEFINRLKEGDIWTNVIIIVKQSINPRCTVWKVLTCS